MRSASAGDRKGTSHRLASSNVDGADTLKLSPSLITAALAGLVAGAAMSTLWVRLANDTMPLLVAFLLLVALPAHAFVVGFGHRQTATPGTVDTALLQRGVTWLIAAAVAIGVMQALGQ